MNTREDLRQFIFAVLDDDEGISEEAWGHLAELLHNTGEFEFLARLATMVDATDGRFYIKEGAA